MILLNCPNCGKRNINEFYYGGELNMRPDSSKATPSQWNSYLYTRDNILGAHKEWWFHRLGCMRWFIAERHTKTHKVYSTYFWTRQE